MSAPAPAPVQQFKKERVALRYWLLGAGFTMAAEALTFAEQHHQGLRKDGRTPEFAHQVGIALYCRTLVPHLRYPEETIAAALLHDTVEDYDVTVAEITNLFGMLVGTATDALSKEVRGVRRPEDVVFAAIEADVIASVVKPADRINNQNSMVGVFGPEKITEYLAETDEWILPMVKRSSRRFPDQEGAYENEKLMLKSQRSIITALSGLGQ